MQYINFLLWQEYSKQFMYSNIVFTEIYDRRAITIVPILLMKKLRKSEISSPNSVSGRASFYAQVVWLHSLLLTTILHCPSDVLSDTILF